MAATRQPGFLALVREDWITHGRDWTRPGFRALFAQRLGVWRLAQPALPRKLLAPIARFLHRRARNRYGIELHATTRIGRRFLVAHQGAIVVHRRAVLGDDVTIRQGCTIGAAADYASEPAPTIGSRVSLGAGSMVLGPITIGDDVNIGPNAVVLGDVPSGSIACAPPARIIQPTSPKKAA